MKIKNGYTKNLIRPSRYNPNDFTATGVALFYTVMLLAFFALPYLSEFTGFSEVLWNVAQGDELFVMCVDVIISQGLILSFALVYSAIKGVNPFSGGGYEMRFDLTPMLFGCMLVAGIQICFSPLHYAFSESAASFGTGGSVAEGGISGNPVWLAVYIVLTLLLPCICEEAAFRGILMRGLSRFGFFVALTLSSSLHALFHGNFQQIILQFTGGVAIGACMYVTKNFAVGAAMHFFNNLFAYGFVVFGETAKRLGVGVYDVTMSFGIIAGLMMLVTGAYYFARYTRCKGAVENGMRRKPVPVLMSAESRAQNSSIVIDASQITEFRKYYPDAMRYKRGGFVSLNKDTKSPVLPALLLALCGVLAVVYVVLNQFGI
ncbi:MAG: CPBP family intramembrane metalloprotease [Clostridia bacterium]|nr:CPBP family intramembrane metalloprotease [Clostridia bacterium]